uniref:SRCR domain-containing protein n=1 Tax=Cyprinus carpio TaxID=7962 RepID=A0A8C1PA66_CYPCA
LTVLFALFINRVNVRLVGGHSRCAGRVEILHRGLWGTVCDAGWDMPDVAVVCRELDCGEPVDAVGDAYFGPGSGPIWTNRMMCTGSETTLKKCGSVMFYEYDCNHDTDAGCAGKNINMRANNSVNVRLVGGHSRCSGTVEVLHRGQWGTVCDEEWDLADAAVVCRELDCGEPVDALSNAHFGAGSGPVWMTFVLCTGSESTLKNCGSFGWGKNNCGHSKDAGVICSDKINVRLVGGHSRCAGRVEVLHRGQWETVCDAGWDLADAAVVCRELDCGEPVDAPGDAHFGSGSGQSWIKNIQCRGNESQIHLCPTSSSHKNNCSHENDVGLVCAGLVLF